ncbi:MAG: metallophosphoesterase, partial [Candidatus Omnitrophica bacterium]|nr:metallophosphoesterase [Candidatus Omnitrophota bacterium]
LIYPEKGLGKEFWNRVYSESLRRFGTTQIPVNTFNKVWIVADRASVYEAKDTVFVVDSHLKVMLDEDYQALHNHKQAPANGTHALGNQVIREVVLPALEKEVNEGRNFANLRQIFNSLILAKWYKETLKNALLNQVYSNKDKIAGVEAADKNIKEKIYEQYVQAYKKGVFNYIKEDIDQATKEPMPRKYFSGGITGALTLEHATAAQERQAIDSEPGRFIEVDSRADISGSNAAMMHHRKIMTRSQIAEQIASINDAARTAGFILDRMGADGKMNIRFERKFNRYFRISRMTAFTLYKGKLYIAHLVQKESPRPQVVFNSFDPQADFFRNVKKDVQPDALPRDVKEAFGFYSSLPESVDAAMAFRMPPKEITLGQQGQIFVPSSGNFVPVKISQNGGVHPSLIIGNNDVYNFNNSPSNGDPREIAVSVWGQALFIKDGNDVLARKVIAEGNGLQIGTLPIFRASELQEAPGLESGEVPTAWIASNPAWGDFRGAVKGAKDFFLTTQEGRVLAGFVLESGGTVASNISENYTYLFDRAMLSGNGNGNGSVKEKLGETPQMGMNALQLAGEIQKDLEHPGSGRIPLIATISDEHGTIDKFDKLIVDILRQVPAGAKIPEGFVLDPDKTLAEQLAPLGINLADFKGQLFIHNLGDFMDRGPYGVKVFFRSKELIDSGLSDFVIGNHDQWMFMNLIGLHLPYYDNFEFYGYKDSYDAKKGGGDVRFLLAQKHKEDPDTRLRSWWAQKLAEHRKFYENLQRTRWSYVDSEVNGENGLYAQVTKGMDEEQKKKWAYTHAGEVWNKLRGYNPEV